MNKPTISIEREPNSNIMHSVLTYGDIVVKERIPIHVLKQDAEYQAGYYRGVLTRLERKIQKAALQSGRTIR